MNTLRPFTGLLGALVALGVWSHAGAAERLQSVVRRVGDAAAPVAADTAKTSRVAGTVVDADGKPVSGATVECYQQDVSAVASGGRDMDLKHRLTTDASGAFEFQVKRGTTILFARKPGLAPAWSQYWNQSKDATGETLVLTPPTTVAGVVVDEKDKPVANAEVFVSMACCMRQREDGATTWGYLNGKLAQDNFSARTGADGRFILQGFPTNAATDLAVKTPGKVLRESPRESIGPDTMRWQAGQQDVKLVVEPAGSVEGKVIAEESGKPIAGAKVWAQPTQPVGFGGVSREPAQSDADGVFRLGNLPAGKYQLRATFGTNSPADWVAEMVTVSVKTNQTTRDVRVSAVRGGMLEVAVVGKVDRKPFADASISASGKGFYTGANSGSNGLALLRLPAGEYRVAANRDYARSEGTSAKVENGRTNHVEIELAPPRKIAGIVRRPSGGPAPGVVISVQPRWGIDPGEIKTDENGAYELSWDPRQYGGQDRVFCLVARDVAGNLAVAQEIEEGATKLDLKLEPGLAVAGRVEDVNGKPLNNANVRLFLWSGNSGSQFEDKPLKTDAQGHYEINALPPGRKYSLDATAKGYGSANQSIEEPSDTNRVEVAACVLKVANHVLAGEVVDADDKPIARANVYMYGQGQPNGSVRTDAKGRFKFDAVCGGSVQLSVSSQSTYGSARAEAGDTNVVVKLGANQSYSFSQAPKRMSIKGKPLPDLAVFELAGDATPAGKPILLCLFDVDQRPSRRFIKQLTEQHDALREKGLVVLGLQAAVTTPAAFKEWKEANAVPFPVGHVAAKADKTKWASEVEAYPWLILTDKDRRVTAEGFALEELDAKLKPLSE